MKYLFMLWLVYSLIRVPVSAAPCVASTPAMESMQQQEITVINDSGRHLSLKVLVADDDFERSGGFQHICPYVIAKQLMLFSYPQARQTRFHMQNVHAPLAIAFFDSTGKLTDMQHMKTYTDTTKPLYGPSIPFQFALEADADFFARHLISPAKSYLKF